MVSAYCKQLLFLLNNYGYLWGFFYVQREGGARRERERERERERVREGVKKKRESTKNIKNELSLCTSETTALFLVQM